MVKTFFTSTFGSNRQKKLNLWRFGINLLNVTPGILFLVILRNLPTRLRDTSGSLPKFVAVMKVLITGADGRITPQPSRTAVKQAPAEEVALRLIRMLRSREREHIFSPLGKIVSFVNRLSPRLMHFILLNVYQRTQG